MDWYQQLTEQEREEWMVALTEADRIHDFYKTHERPMTLCETMMECQHKREVERWD